MRKEIREWNGRIVGYIEDHGAGDKVGKTFTGKIVGYYKSSQDVTTDFYGRIVAKGDILSALVWQER